jgi:hypothetical protein
MYCSLVDTPEEAEIAALLNSQSSRIFLEKLILIQTVHKFLILYQSKAPLRYSQQFIIASSPQAV